MELQKSFQLLFPKIFLFFIIFSLSQQIISEEDADVLKIKQFMQKNDKLKLELSDIIPLNHLSLKFSSNRQTIKFPGIPDEPKHSLHSDINFDPLVLKSENSRIFILSNNKKDFYQFLFESQEKVSKIESVFSKELSLEKGLHCNDMEFTNQNRLALLCLKGEDLKIIVADYLTQEMIINIGIQNQGFTNPKLKLLNINEKNPNLFLFLIFNKISNLQNEKNVIQVIVDFEKKQIISQKILDIQTEILKNEQITGFLENINLRKDIIQLSIQKDNIITVFESKFTILEEKNLQFDAPTTIASNFLHFSSNEKFYIGCTQTEIGFCDNKKIGFDLCEKGSLKDNWKIQQILIEKSLGVVTIKIGSEKTVFVKDFLNKSFNWYSDESDNDKISYLINASVDNKQNYYKVIFEEKGFKMSLMSVSDVIEVNTSDLTNLDKTDISLKYSKLMELNLIKWDEKSKKTVNYNEGQIYKVARSKNGNFIIPISYAGENLQFEDSFNEVFYFNSVEVFGLSFPEKAFYFCSSKRPIYITNDKVYQQICESDESGRKVVLCHTKTTNIVPSIDVNEISLCSEVEDQIWIMVNNPGKLLILENEQITTVKEAGNWLDHVSSCRIVLDLVFCLIDRVDTVSKIQFTTPRILISSLPKEKYMEISDKIEQDFIKALILNITILNKQMKITQITIIDFEFTSAKPERIIGLIGFTDGNVFQTVLAEFKIEFYNNPGLEFKRFLYSDEQKIGKETNLYGLEETILFINSGLNFQMFAYDNESYFELKYYNVDGEVVREIMPEHNLVGTIFQVHRGPKLFVLFKVTSNAVDQIIQEVELKINFTSLRFYPLNKYMVWVLLYNANDQMSFIYYANGPFVVTNYLGNDLIINNMSFSLNAEEERLFDQDGVDIIKPLSMKPTETVELSNYISVEGNLVGIESSNPHLQIIEPLSLELQKLNIKVNQNFKYLSTNSYYGVVINVETVYQFEFQNGFSHQIFKEYRCSKVVLGEISVFCIISQGAQTQIISKNLQNDIYEEYRLSVTPNEKLKMIEDNSERFTLLYINQENTHLIINRINRKSKKVVTKVISRKKFYVPDLKINSFYSALVKKRLTIIILDDINSQLGIISYDIESLKHFRILRKSFSLTHLQLSFYALQCTNISDNYNCQLFSDTYIYQTTIQPSELLPISRFGWKFTVEKSYMNVSNQKGGKNRAINSCLSNDYLMVSDPSLALLLIYKKNSSYTFYQKKSFEVYEMQYLKDNSVKILALERGKESLSLIQYILTLKDYSMIAEKDFEAKEETGIKIKFSNDRINNIQVNISEIKPIISEHERSQTLKIVFIIITIILSIIILLLIFMMYMMYRGAKKNNEEKSKVFGETVGMTNQYKIQYRK